jgi:hypothetical protein
VCTVSDSFVFQAADITASMKDGMLQLSWPSGSRSDDEDTPIPIKSA